MKLESISAYYEDNIDSQMAYDQQFLKEANTKQKNMIRFWESRDYAVVLGLSNKKEEHAFIERCQKDGVAIIKRSSGGGSVLQGPGCINYAVYLNYDDFPICKNLNSTSDFVLSTVCKALHTCGRDAQIKGISDIAIGDKKCIGHAQRRLKHACLFHGSMLNTFDMSKISAYLKYPPKYPEYRKKRNHDDFLCNLQLEPQRLMDSIKDAFLNASIKTA